MIKGTSKNIFAISLLFLLGSVLQAQDCNLIGSWKLTGSKVLGKYMGQNENVEWVNSFYNDTLVQTTMMQSLDITDESQFYQNAKWRLNGDRLKLNFTENNLSGKDENEVDYKLISCTESNLVLESKSLEQGMVVYYFEKLDQMRPLVEFPLKEEEGSGVEEASSRIFLINKLNPKKRVELKDSYYLELTFQQESQNYPGQFKSVRWNGDVVDIHGDYMKFDIATESSTLYAKYNDLTVNLNEYITSTDDICFTKDILISDIQYIDRQSRRSGSFREVAGFMALIGTMGMLVATPILSIDSKNGTFDRNMFYAVGGASLGMALIAIPISIFSRTRHYQIKEDEFCDEQDLWILVK